MRRSKRWRAGYVFLLVLCVTAGWRSLGSADSTTTTRPAAVPHFRNDAARWQLGMRVQQAQLVDVDGDGWLDCIVNSSQLLLNRGNDTGGRQFVDFTAESGIGQRRSHTGGTAGTGVRPTFVAFGDVDGDGDLDLFSGVRSEIEFWKKDSSTGEPLVDADGARVLATPDPGWRNEIYRNDGTGRFSVIANSGVSTAAESTTSATFLDFDLDGNLDLFVGNWYRSYGWSYDAYPDRLYRGNGDGTFTDVTKSAGLSLETAAGQRTSCRPTFGVASVDWNNDGFPDLFACSYGRRWNQQWRNNGDGTFTELAESTSFDGDAIRSGHYAVPGRAAEQPFRSNGNTFDVTFADFDNDGDIDGFLAEIAHAWAGSSSDRSSLLENLGATEGYRFRRRSDTQIDRETANQRNWNDGDIYGGWIDANGDGLEDAFVSSSDYPDDQRLRLFVQGSDHRFSDRTDAFGLDWPASNMPSVGDVDGDGDPDLLVARSLNRLGKQRRAELGDRAALWINHGANDQNWCKLQLRGKGAGGCNRRGIGCRVVVELSGRTLHRFVQSASGHAGHQNPDDLLIGLGTDQAIERLTIHWANAARTKTEFHDIVANHRVTITEPAPGGTAKLQITPFDN
ncbi:MAG: CRTAC1 family protein [Planctomycetota bacterium]